MSGDSLLEQLLAYVAPDRARAVLRGESLPEVSDGSVLFSDISGFTPLTEAVISRYGPRRGGEEFTNRLNEVYGALITVVERYGGNIIGFAGDAMAAWLPGDDGSLAIAAALEMQEAMRQFGRVVLPGGEVVSLSMKVAVSSGTLRRFAVGDPEIQLFDVLAGAAMERLSSCEGAAQRGEVVVDERTAEPLAARLEIHAWRSLPPGSQPERVAVVTALTAAVATPGLPPRETSVDPERLRPWLIPEVFRRLAGGHDAFLTELRPAAALFLHFSGIDFAEDPAAPEKLDLYFRRVQHIVSQLEGVIVQLTIGEKGSYLYAAFGAPVAHDDDVTRAFIAALELLHAPPEIRQVVPHVQIGVTRGTMRTGAYGGRRRRTYGVLGDDVNLSARLMARARPDEILVSEPAARRRLAMFELEALPAIQVKGKSMPIPVFRLHGRKRAAGAGHGALVAGTPLIGRAQELATAVDRLERARAGLGQVVGLGAEAGMGKTRLLIEIVRVAQARGFTVVTGDCPVLAREASYSVWAPILRALLQIDTGIHADSGLATVETRLAAIDPALVLRAPLLAPVLNVALPDNDLTRTLEGKVRRASLDSLVIEIVRYRSRQAPLVIVLEECHWIDAASRHLLRALAQAVARLPVALVLAHRPVGPDDLLGAEERTLDYFTEITLGDLPPDEARQLITHHLSGLPGTAAGIPVQLVEMIAARASGSPFFIEEVVHLLKSRGIALDDPRLLETLELPASLHSLVLGRIDQLSGDAQTTLKVASVIGRLFRSAMVFGVHPLERGRLGITGHLTEMLARDMVLPDTADAGDAYLFRHLVIQEVAYESLPYALRAAIHEAIGLHIEKAAGGDLRPWIDLLAFHFDRTARDDKKRVYLVAAGDAARSAYGVPSAISYYERALPLLEAAERIEVLIHLAEVLELAGRWNEAFTRYREARSIAESAGTAAQRSTIAGLLGDLHRRRGEFDHAASWLARAREENAQQGNDSGVALMLHLEGTLAAQLGQFARAAQLLQEAHALRERLGEELNAAKSLNNLGIVARSQGDVATALVYYERSLAIRRRLNDRREIANSLNNLGFAYRFQRDYDRARQLLEESVKVNRAIGDRWSTANALTSLAELALDTGDAAQAGSCLHESITINRELGDRRALAFLIEASGHLARLRQNAREALVFFAAARALRASIGAPLEPADAAKLENVLRSLREQLDGAAVEAAEHEGASLPLGTVLDRTQSLSA